jgi:hypothetical protein
MTPEKEILFSLTAHPGLFETKGEVLCHIFFTTGGGYEWVDGQLSSVEYWEPDASLQRVYEEGVRVYYEVEEFSLQTRVKIYELRMSLFNETELEKPKIREHPGYPSEQSLRELKISNDHNYWVSEYWNINHIPDNVSAEWLQAAKEALIAFADVKVSKQGRDFLDKAKTRIAELEKQLP